MLQKAAFRSQAKEAAGSQAHQRLGLLITTGKGIFPDMPPGRKTLEGMGGNLQRQNTGKAKGRNGQGHGTHAAGT